MHPALGPFLMTQESSMALVSWMTQHQNPHPRLLHLKPHPKNRLGKRTVTASEDEAGLKLDEAAQTQEDGLVKEESDRNKEEALRNEYEKQRAEEDARRAKEEEDRLKKEQADSEARAEAERKRVAAEDAQKAKEEADRQAAETARLAKEAADRKAQEDMIRKAQEEADKKIKDQAEADKKKEEEEDQKNKDKEKEKEKDKDKDKEKDEDDDNKKDDGQAEDSQFAQNEGRNKSDTTTTDKSKMFTAISIASGGIVCAAFVVGLVFARARQARKRNSARDAYLARKVDLDPIYGPATPFSRMSRSDDRHGGGPVASAMMGSHPHPHHSTRQSLQSMQEMHHHRHHDETHDRRDSAWATGMPSLIAAPHPAHLSRMSHEFGGKHQQQHPTQHRHTRHSLVPGSLNSEVLSQQQQQQQRPQQQQQQHVPPQRQFHGRYSVDSHPSGRHRSFQEPALANPPSAISHTRRESRPASILSQPRLPHVDPHNQNELPRF
ncbi:hypothetical protein BGZ70_006417 [Mortierella alpina]|uniref:Uncharacterized protein n=1 Tax=Mortierella alpina TaxID=64518 RepID=A0A9P6JEQ4_MORAP|nr:hypothetical protein BGZ70_006417 [Mortierella alpina]